MPLQLRRSASWRSSRSERRNPETVLYAGELEIRPDEGFVLATGQPLVLSVREFEVLVAMAEAVGAIIHARLSLQDGVGRRAASPADRSVDVYVSKLRSKLEDALPDRRFIHTPSGFGYTLQLSSRNVYTEAASG